jgi:hypothetical protein
MNFVAQFLPDSSYRAYGLVVRTPGTDRGYMQYADEWKRDRWEEVELGMLGWVEKGSPTGGGLAGLGVVKYNHTDTATRRFLDVIGNPGPSADDLLSGRYAASLRRY